MPGRIPDVYNHELQSIIDSMLSKDSSLRPSCEQILGNKYVVLYLSRKLAGMTKRYWEINE